MADPFLILQKMVRKPLQKAPPPRSFLLMLLQPEIIQTPFPKPPSRQGKSDCAISVYYIFGVEWILVSNIIPPNYNQSYGGQDVRQLTQNWQDALFTAMMDRELEMETKNS